MSDTHSNDLPRPSVLRPALCCGGLLWLSQPPLQLWCLGFLSIVPLIYLISTKQRFRKRDYFKLWMVLSIYWLVSLQGLRHAHPLMHGPWLALGTYLAVYQTLFVAVSRYLYHRGIGLLVVVPMVWVAQEYARNYLLTGISVLMLGHALVNVPVFVQIADLFGSYGVSAFLALVNLGLWQTYQVFCRRILPKQYLPVLAVTVVSLIAVPAYGLYRISQPMGRKMATFALIQRDEAVEYVLDPDRQVEMFQNYAASSVEAARLTPQVIDAYLWPESMYSATNPYVIADVDAVVPPQFPGTPADFENSIRR